MTAEAVIAHSATVLEGGLRRLSDVLTEQGVNPLANNLGIPIDLEHAVEAGLHGNSHAIDVGKMNGEHFAVMAGTGLGALMIRDADSASRATLPR